MTITFLNPVQEAEHNPAVTAQRLKSMKGIRLGLLSNRKTNAGELLTMIGEELEALHGLAAVEIFSKPFPGSNCPEGVIEDLAGKVDAVITGLGD